MSRKKVLFVGSFLSNSKATKPIAEKIQPLLSDVYEIDITSRKKNKVLRLLEILWHVLTGKHTIIITDVFSGQAILISYLVVMVARCFTKKRVVANLRGGRLVHFYNEGNQRLTYILKNVHTIISPSQYLSTSFNQLGFKVNILPNFINLDQFRYQSPSEQNISLLWVRAFIRTYNPEIAVEIVNRLKNKYPDIRLTMVGPDDGLMTSCKELAIKYNLTEQITFTGPVRNEELPSFYHSHNIFLNTTSYESFGVAIMEAAACGIPVVSNNVGEIPFLWKNGENIMLINNNSVEEFCEAIIKLTEGKQLNNTISINARKRAENFSWPAIRKEWINLLGE